MAPKGMLQAGEKLSEALIGCNSAPKYRSVVSFGVSAKPLCPVSSQFLEGRSLLKSTLVQQLPARLSHRYAVISIKGNLGCTYEPLLILLTAICIVEQGSKADELSTGVDLR